MSSQWSRGFARRHQVYLDIWSFAGRRWLEHIQCGPPSYDDNTLSGWNQNYDTYSRRGLLWFPQHSPQRWGQHPGDNQRPPQHPRIIPCLGKENQLKCAAHNGVEIKCLRWYTTHLIQQYDGLLRVSQCSETKRPVLELPFVHVPRG